MANLHSVQQKVLLYGGLEDPDCIAITGLMWGNQGRRRVVWSETRFERDGAAGVLAPSLLFS